jgi:hypothetical protein
LPQIDSCGIRASKLLLERNDASFGRRYFLSELIDACFRLS